MRKNRTSRAKVRTIDDLKGKSRASFIAEAEGSISRLKSDVAGKYALGGWDGEGAAVFRKKGTKAWDRDVSRYEAEKRKRLAEASKSAKAGPSRIEVMSRKNPRLLGPSAPVLKKGQSPSAAMAMYGFDVGLSKDAPSAEKAIRARSRAHYAGKAAKESKALPQGASANGARAYSEGQYEFKPGYFDKSKKPNIPSYAEQEDAIEAKVAKKYGIQPRPRGERYPSGSAKNASSRKK